MRTNTLLLQFRNNISAHQLPAFRGAVVSLVGIEQDYYHNHDNQNHSFHYRYPLIQYRLNKINKRAYPSILFIGKGTEVAHKFLNLPDWTINLNGRKMELELNGKPDSDLHELKMGMPITYSISNWLALNQKNHERYHAMPGLIERISFLEKQLVNCIIAFAKGIGWIPEQEIVVQILNIDKVQAASLKDVDQMMAFDLTFKVNAILLENIGLGKSVSRGFGVIQSFKMKSNNNHKKSIHA